MKRDFALPASPARVDDDVAAELRFHIEERRAELIAGGMSAADADAEVRRRFGDAATYQRETSAIDHQRLREERRAHFLTSLVHETRRSVRSLLRDRTFSVLAFGTLALGIGATVAMFAVLDAVVLRPLPYPNADRLVSVTHPATVPGSGERKWGISPGGYVHFARDAKTVEKFGIYRTMGFTVLTGGDAEVAQVAIATHEVLGILGARAELGRLIEPEDDAPGKTMTVVLSHEYHQRRFGGDPRIVGTTLDTEYGSLLVIGVTTPGVTAPMPGPFADQTDLKGFGVDLWIPARVNRAGPFHNTHPNVGIGLLRPGATVAGANAEFSTLLTRFAEQMPNAYSKRFLDNYNFRVEVTTLRDGVTGTAVPHALWLLFGAVALVLLIAAANVGNLFLVRFEARRREAAVRTALGADRIQLAAHYLSESILVCGAAAVAALGVAWGTLRVVLALAPSDIPRLGAVSVDARVVAVSLGLGLGLGIVLGLLPLLRRELDVNALRDSSRGLSASPRQRVARHTLVVAQVALSLMLLAATGLVWRSFIQLRAVPAGFDMSNTLAFEVAIPTVAYRTNASMIAAHRALTDRLQVIPGVTSVGAGPVPLEDFGTGCSIVFREGRPFASGEQPPCVASAAVLPGWFETLGITVNGSASTWRDLDARTQPAVITRALADRLWPGEDPIGKGIGNNGPDSKLWFRVAGVVPELRLESLALEPTEAVFYPATTLYEDYGSDDIASAAYLLRTDGRDPLSLVTAVRDAVRAVDTRMPVIAPRTLESVAQRSMARTSFTLALLGFAGVLGLVLSAVGLYGVVSYIVQQRRGELGLRLALGDTPAGVRRLVLGQSMTLGAIGVVLGLAGSVAANRALEAMLYRVRAVDPVVLVGVSVLLLATVTFAGWGPARRATRIEPVEAMRG